MQPNSSELAVTYAIMLGAWFERNKHPINIIRCTDGKVSVYGHTEASAAIGWLTAKGCYYIDGHGQLVRRKYEEHQVEYYNDASS